MSLLFSTLTVILWIFDFVMSLFEGFLGFIFSVVFN